MLSELPQSDQDAQASDTSTEEAPPPATEEAPKPATEEAPKPATEEAPKPATEEAPKPATEEAPQPATEEAPQPATEEAPKPATEEAPKPVAEKSAQPATEESRSQPVEEQKPYSPKNDAFAKNTKREPYKRVDKEYPAGDSSFNKRKKPYLGKRVSYFVKNPDAPINYKRVDILVKFLSDKGKIMPRKFTGLSALHQRRVAKEIKKARHASLLPYVYK